MSTRTGTVLAVVAALSLMLGGCGFKPLYGERADGTSVQDDLAQVEIPMKSTRLDQLVRNEIIASSRPRGTEQPDRYVLEFATESSEVDAISTTDTFVRRNHFTVKSTFTLRENGSGAVLLQGRSFSQVPYDRTRASFSNVQARTNAQERAAKEIGNDIRTRLAAYFSSR